MYIGSAGPGPGGRTGRPDFERQYNNFHRFSQKASKNTVFVCRFASGGSASTDFYSSNEKCVQKMSKNKVFLDFSNHARARVPIFTPKMKNFRFARLARFSTRKWDFRRRARPRELAQRSQDDVSLNKLPQIIGKTVEDNERITWEPKATCGCADFFQQ